MGPCKSWVRVRAVRDPFSSAAVAGIRISPPQSGSLYTNTLAAGSALFITAPDLGLRSSRLEPVSPGWRLPHGLGPPTQGGSDGDNP